MQRKFPRQIKKIVVKIGSSLVATDKLKPRMSFLRSLVDQICSIQNKGIEAVVVSSGAIVYGMGELGLKERPKELSSLQALAALGQTILMDKYSGLFKKNRKRCAQVLLTWDDFNNRTRYNNAGNTFGAILDNKIVPIVNENDTISTDEIKFGDNDKLSALVASLIQADLLIILSDVEGLYDLKSPKKEIFKEVKEITDYIEGVACGTNKVHISKGGMSAKIDAVKIAVNSKVPCVIASGHTKNVISRIINGEQIGTFFMEKEEKLLARKHWISFGVKPKGILVIDDGAKNAILQGGKSLLLPGIISWEGFFNIDDIVVVQEMNKKEIARGIINYSARDLDKIVDKKGKLEAIHCDNLVLSER